MKKLILFFCFFGFVGNVFANEKLFINKNLQLKSNNFEVPNCGAVILNYNFYEDYSFDLIRSCETSDRKWNFSGTWEYSNIDTNHKVIAKVLVNDKIYIDFVFVDFEKSEGQIHIKNGTERKKDRYTVLNIKSIDNEEVTNQKDEIKKDIKVNAENKLYEGYTFYIGVKKFHEASSDYYVATNQMREAKSQIKEIEKILVEKNSTMNTDSIWERAVQKIDKDLDANTMSIAATNTTPQFQAMAKIYIMGLADIYNKLVGPKKIKKDF
tara:strand:+ start:65 stop:865 length:801 start_codon:yes stop_codon:yes gene_type:complete